MVCTRLTTGPLTKLMVSATALPVTARLVANDRSLIVETFEKVMVWDGQGMGAGAGAAVERDGICERAATVVDGQGGIDVLAGGAGDSRVGQDIDAGGRSNRLLEHCYAVFGKLKIRAVFFENVVVDPA